MPAAPRRRSVASTTAVGKMARVGAEGQGHGRAGGEDGGREVGAERPGHQEVGGAAVEDQELPGRDQCGRRGEEGGQGDPARVQSVHGGLPGCSVASTVAPAGGVLMDHR
jgi:hypothetical protein